MGRTRATPCGNARELITNYLPFVPSKRDTYDERPNMKHHLAVLFGGLFCLGTLTPTTAEARTVVIVHKHHKKHHHHRRHHRRVWISSHYVVRHSHRIWLPGHYIVL